MKKIKSLCSDIFVELENENKKSLNSINSVYHSAPKELSETTPKLFQNMKFVHDSHLYIFGSFSQTQPKLNLNSKIFCNKKAVQISLKSINKSVQNLELFKINQNNSKNNLNILSQLNLIQGEHIEKSNQISIFSKTKKISKNFNHRNLNFIRNKRRSRQFLQKENNTSIQNYTSINNFDEIEQKNEIKPISRIASMVILEDKKKETSITNSSNEILNKLENGTSNHYLSELIDRE